MLLFTMDSIDNVASTISLQLNDIRTALRNLLLTNEFDLKSYYISPAGDGIMGFAGDHYRLTATYELYGKISNVTLFVKSFPEHNEERAAFNDKYGIFQREIFIYTKVFDKFNKAKECTQWHPECLLISGKTLIFEDLKIKGYKICDISDTMDDAHCLVTLTSLARFHASTFIYEEKHDDEKFRLLNAFKDDLKLSNFVYNDWFKISIERALQLAESSVKYGKTTSHFEAIARKWKDTCKRGIESSLGSNDSRNVLTHGDLWNNNLMYRYDDDGKPIQCILIDFQLSRFAPPAADVMFYLYMNTSIEQLSERMNTYLSHYYDQLSNALSENDIDVKNILPRNDFLNTCIVYQNWGMIQSLIHSQLVLLDDADTIDARENPETFIKSEGNQPTHGLFKKMETDPVYRKRMMTLIDEYIRVCVLKC